MLQAEVEGLQAQAEGEELEELPPVIPDLFADAPLGVRILVTKPLGPKDLKPGFVYLFKARPGEHAYEQCLRVHTLLIMHSMATYCSCALTDITSLQMAFLAFMVDL